MLWLEGNRSIEKVLLRHYIDVIQKQGFTIRKTLQRPRSSYVCLASSNTVVKVLNPSLGKYQFENFFRANGLFLKCGIETPRNLSYKKVANFYIIESEYINPELFLDKLSLAKADEVFFDFFNHLSKEVATFFGPLTQEKFLPPVFSNCDYITYWDRHMEYFLTKAPPLSYFFMIKTHYKKLRRKISVPKQFVFSHSDISPKHIFKRGFSKGCIDLEEAMYLDSSFMWALWYVRTFCGRDKINNRKFLNKFFLQNLNFDLFNFHIFRELFIQYYYRRSLQYFFRDYSQLLKGFDSSYEIDKDKNM